MASPFQFLFSKTPINISIYKPIILSTFYRFTPYPRQDERPKRNLPYRERTSSTNMRTKVSNIEGPYEAGKPDATFSFTDEDFIKLVTGNLNAQMAFMRGSIKVKGSLSAAQKLTPDITKM